MIRVPTTENPVLLDRVLVQLQEALAADVAWLDHSFGKAQRLVKRELDQRDRYYPAVYTGEAEYISVLPDSRLGNFTFFDIPDGYTFSVYNRFQVNTFTTPFRLIAFFNEETIFGPGLSNREQLKMEILSVLGRTPLRDGGLRIERVNERHENIYRGYSLAEVDTQYLMQPYGAFSVEGRLELSEACITL